MNGYRRMRDGQFPSHVLNVMHFYLMMKIQMHHCPTSPVSRDWQGLVIVPNPEMSEVGKRMGVTRAELCTEGERTLGD